MLVSVVIPTLDRPKLLLRAIDSVLYQTYEKIEVIVVVDRPDPETISAVRAVNDPRLQLIVNPQPSTAAGARLNRPPVLAIAQIIARSSKSSVGSHWSNSRR